MSTASLAVPQWNPSARTAAATRARTTHGLYTQFTVLPGEDPAAFAAFHQAMADDLAPEGETEAQMVLQLAAAQWKLQRLWAQEAGVQMKYEERNGGRDNPLPRRIADCGIADGYRDRQMDRISLDLQRTANRFRLTLRTLALTREMRNKGLLGERPPRGQSVPTALEASQALPALPARQPSETPVVADRPQVEQPEPNDGQGAAEENREAPAALPEQLAQQQSRAHADMSTSASSDGTSQENADRGADVASPPGSLNRTARRRQRRAERDAARQAQRQARREANSSAERARTQAEDEEDEDEAILAEFRRIYLGGQPQGDDG